MKTKTLPRTTSCTLFEIKAPVWNGGKRRVGLAEYRISDHNEIRFLYKRKDGTLSMPGNFYFPGSALKEIDFERMNVKGLTLVMVPFDDLYELKREGDQEETLQEWLDKPGYAKTKEELNEKD